MEEQGEMIALKPQDKYRLYLAAQSTGGDQLAIGSMMHHSDSAAMTHQALASITPALVCQLWLAASSIMMHQSSHTLPCF